MALYAKQAKDRDLIDYATDIKLRAEARAGELLIEMAENRERDVGAGGDRKSQSQPPTVKLADLGITKDQSSRWQKLAQLDPKEREQKIAKLKAKAQAAIDPKPKKVVKRKSQPDSQPWELYVQDFRMLLRKWFKKLPSECWSDLVDGLHDELSKTQRLTRG